MIEATVGGWTDGYVIEPLQKPLFIKAECLFAAGLEPVVSRNVWRGFDPQTSPAFAVFLVGF